MVRKASLQCFLKMIFQTKKIIWKKRIANIAAQIDGAIKLSANVPFQTYYSKINKYCCMEQKTMAATMAPTMIRVRPKISSNVKNTASIPIESHAMLARL